MINESGEERRKRIVEALTQKPRMQGVYQQCLSAREAYIAEHPEHEGRRLDLDPYYDGRGSIRYFPEMVDIRFNSESGNSEVFLAHELLHYTLALQGTLLPVVVEETPDENVRYVRRILYSGVSLHPLINHRLACYDYEQDLLDTSLSLGQLLKPRSRWYNPGSRRLELLDSIDRSVFIPGDKTEEVMRPVMEEYDLVDLYDSMRSTASGDGIEHTNDLSRKVLQTYGMEHQIDLVDLEEYIQRGGDYND